MPTGELIPYFEPGTRPTGYATDTIRVGRLVSIADTVPGGMDGTENMQIKECAGATEVPVAVACQGGVEGEQLGLLGLRSNAVVPLVAGAVDVTAGDLLMSDAEGRVVPLVTGDAADGDPIPSLPVVVGTAVEDQATTGDPVGVWLN